MKQKEPPERYAMLKALFRAKNHIFEELTNNLHKRLNDYGYKFRHSDVKAGGGYPAA